MKAIFIMLLLSVSFQLNIAMAVENIIGTWQGELSLDTGKKVTVQFLIDREDDGNYAVVMSLPDETGTGDIEASSVVFRSGKLTLEVPELSGLYDGMLTDGEIVGQWHQEGGFIPLTSSRFEPLPLSDEDKEKLLGKWYGKPVCRRGGIGGGPVYSFEFEIEEGQNFKGILKIYLADGKICTNKVIDEMGKNGDCFIFKPFTNLKYTGRLAENEIVGEIKHFDQQPGSLTLKKGEYIHNLNTKLDLPDNVEKFLSGKWNGKVVQEWKEREGQFSMVMVFEFEKTETGDFKGHIISRDQLDEVIPITKAISNNDKLILKTEDFDVQFEMKLSGDTLIGEWTQCGVGYPLTIVKEGS